jgi:hypothetical protein
VRREPAYFALLEACRRELPDNVAYSRRNGCWVATPLPPSVAAANPTAQINGPAVNGIASTYMRSDAAPALEIGDGAVARIARERSRSATGGRPTCPPAPAAAGSSRNNA